jgi:replicative DNA helicase
MSERPPRVFPHSVDTERSLLGGVMIDGSLLDEVRELVSPDDFYRPDHRALFVLLCRMSADNVPIDQVTVPERIMREGRTDTYGGLPYVIELVDHVPATANIRHYAAVVREKADRRRLIEQLQALEGEAFGGHLSNDELVAQASSALAAVRRGSTAETWFPTAELVDETIERMVARGERGGISGVPTGFADLDACLNGLQPGDLVVLGGRPSMGKSALALNIADNVGMLSGLPVGYFSLEMGRHSLVDRSLACAARVDGMRIREGRLDAPEWDRLEEARGLLRRSLVHIDDSAVLRMLDVRLRARKLEAKRGKLGLVVVDYVALLQADNPAERREQQIGGLTRACKAMAKDLDVPVLVLAQLSRKVEERADKRPVLADLRDSGSIEQDADVVLFVYRDEYYNKESPDAGTAEVIVAKQRNGPLGTVKLGFNAKHSRFDDLGSARTSGLDL